MQKARARMKMLQRLPLGAILSAVSAIICAVPTLLLPADSPNAPKVVFLIAAAVVFAVGVARTRSEGGTRRAASPDGDGEASDSAPR